MKRVFVMNRVTRKMSWEKVLAMNMTISSFNVTKSSLFFLMNKYDASHIEV